MYTMNKLIHNVIWFLDQHSIRYSIESQQYDTITLGFMVDIPYTFTTGDNYSIQGQMEQKDKLTISIEDNTILYQVNHEPTQMVSTNEIDKLLKFITSRYGLNS